MKCRNCGYENKDDSLFCEACGAQLIKPVSYEPDEKEINRITDEDLEYREVDEETLEEERRMRMERRNALREQRQKEQNKKTIIIGIIVAAVIAVAGIGAFFGIEYFMNKGANDPTADKSTQKISESLKDQLNKDKNVTITPDVTATPKPTQPVVTPMATETPTPEPTEDPDAPAKAEIVVSSTVDKSGYSKTAVSSAQASSQIQQDGYDNSAAVTLDGDETTSWQEGADGDGIGEFLYYKLDRDYDVRYITFKMGNWRDQKNYDENNRPKDITVWVGDEYFEVTVPNEKTEYCLKLSKDVKASEIYVQIDSVYKGTHWSDTCISEVGIYGK